MAEILNYSNRFVMYSTILVLISLGITVLTTRWANDNRLSAAIRLTTYTRWVFPLIFILIIVVTLSR